MSDKQLESYNPEKMNDDLVIFNNPSSWVFTDKTPSGFKFNLDPGESKNIQKTLAIWFIGDYESPFWKDGVATVDEMAAIYSRNRYHKIFCRVLGPAPEGSKPDLKETVENPQERLKELAEKPEKIVVDMSHLEKGKNLNRVGGPNFQ